MRETEHSHRVLLGFLLYCAAVAVFSSVMIYKVSPKYGKKNPLIYISICSTVGSVSVMAVKAFGIALKLTLAGNNQFSHPSTYAFAIVVIVCILTQMNYFNKALSQFSTSLYAGLIISVHWCESKLTNEQGKPSILCDVHYRHLMRLLHSIPRFQYG